MSNQRFGIRIEPPNSTAYGESSRNRPMENDMKTEPTMCISMAHYRYLMEHIAELEAALMGIRSAVYRRQLPITNEVWEIANSALPARDRLT